MDNSLPLTKEILVLKNRIIFGKSFIGEDILRFRTKTWIGICTFPAILKHIWKGLLHPPSVQSACPESFS